jgi:hypothetical protein
VSEAKSAGWQGPRLAVVIGLIAAVVVAMGVFATVRYNASERWVQRALSELEARGAGLDAEGCVSATLEWHKNCEATKVLCDNAVSMAMFHCLRKQDRAAACSSIDRAAPTGQWVFKRCEARGTPCKVMKQCPCAQSYRALDSYCRTDGEAVQVEL